MKGQELINILDTPSGILCEENILEKQAWKGREVSGPSQWSEKGVGSSDQNNYSEDRGKWGIWDELGI